MVKYVKASADMMYAGWYDKSKGWTDEDIQTHKQIDWKARNYRELPDTSDTFSGMVSIYHEDAPTEHRPVEFVKWFRPNAIFPPYYAPKDKLDVFSPEEADYYVGPMYNGNTYKSYMVHDRYETQELYDMLMD